MIVARKTTVAEGVVTVELRATDGAPLPAWTPGAHIDLGCGGLTRQYSLCGDPADLSTYRIAVRREIPGRGGSRFVHDDLAEGDTVAFAGPRNQFPFVAAKRHVFVAGGIGITPILPMLAAAQRDESDWRLAYGGRTRASMPFVDELLRRYPGRATVHPEDEVGLLDLDALVGAPDPGTAVFGCGPEPLLLALERRATAWQDAALHVERFVPKDLGPVFDTAFEVEIASTGEVLPVPADRSVLDVLVDAGIPVLSSCTQGTCGTCETGVLGGAVDHRDSLLSADEQRANDVMFVCVSRGRSPRLVLDL